MSYKIDSMLVEHLKMISGNRNINTLLACGNEMLIHAQILPVTGFDKYPEAIVNYPQICGEICSAYRRSSPKDEKMS